MIVDTLIAKIKDANKQIKTLTDENTSMKQALKNSESVTRDTSSSSSISQSTLVNECSDNSLLLSKTKAKNQRNRDKKKHSQDSHHQDPQGLEILPSVINNKDVEHIPSVIDNKNDIPTVASVNRVLVMSEIFESKVGFSEAISDDDTQIISRDDNNTKDHSLVAPEPSLPNEIDSAADNITLDVVLAANKALQEQMRVLELTMTEMSRKFINFEERLNVVEIECYV